MTEAQLKASPVLLSLMKREIETIGGQLRNVLAHRQSSEDREYDPGWHCWQTVGLDWQNRIGVKSDVSATWKTGKTIPREWDPSSPHKFR